MVDKMHHQVSGTTLDGRPYAASDQATLRFAHSAFAYGFAAAHLRYHPSPLDAAGIDRYIADYGVIGDAMGVEDCPQTMAAAIECLEARLPMLALTENSVRLVDLMDSLKIGGPIGGRFKSLAGWAAFDLMPGFAKRLWRLPRESRVE
jgi:uncharacterized protein (DUF2236 family)